MARRREFLIGVSTASTAAIAGCSSNSDNTEEGADRAVEQFLTAAEEGDAETTNEFLHPESEAYPIEQNDLDGGSAVITGVDAEEISTTELAQRDVYGGDAGTAEELENLKQEIKADLGANKVTYVLVTIEYDDRQRGTEEHPVPVAKHEGRWKMIDNYYS